MREQFIQILAQVLSNNIGQKLTHELATGIATVVNQAVAEVAAASDTQTLKSTPES
jgi:hypothetical protein